MAILELWIFKLGDTKLGRYYLVPSQQKLGQILVNNFSIDEILEKSYKFTIDDLLLTKVGFVLKYFYSLKNSQVYCFKF